MSPADTREYFQTAIDFFAERYGSKNLMYAQVHLDERTPHMHLGIVPFDKDNKLTAKPCSIGKLCRIFRMNYHST